MRFLAHWQAPVPPEPPQNVLLLKPHHVQFEKLKVLLVSLYHVGSNLFDSILMGLLSEFVVSFDSFGDRGSRQTDKQAGRQAGRQADRQAGRAVASPLPIKPKN